MAFRSILQAFFRLGRALRGRKPAPTVRVIDARAANSPWLSDLLAELGERYQLGADQPDGIQLLCRTGRARFNPMRVYLRAAEHGLAVDYDARVHDGATLDQGRALLDRKVGQHLGGWGISPAGETVEAWAGQVITRRYQGRCDDVRAAAEAVRFACQESEPMYDTASD